MKQINETEDVAHNQLFQNLKRGLFGGLKSGLIPILIGNVIFWGFIALFWLSLSTFMPPEAYGLTNYYFSLVTGWEGPPGKGRG